MKNFLEFVEANKDKVDVWTPDEFVEKWKNIARVKSIIGWSEENPQIKELLAKPTSGSVIVTEQETGLSVSFRGTRSFLLHGILSLMAQMFQEKDLEITHKLSDEELKKYGSILADAAMIMIGKKPLVTKPNNQFPSLAVWLATQRTARGWTKRQLASRVGLSTYIIQRMELGKSEHFNDATYSKLEQVFGVNVPLDFRKTKRRGYVKPRTEQLQDFWAGK